MSALVAAVRQDLRAIAQLERAASMQAYMKSAMPFLGVPVPAVRRVTRTCATAQPVASEFELEAIVRELWDEAGFREERYAATAMLDVPSVRGLRNPAQLALLRDLIVDRAWWDHVDELAHRVGELLRLFPDEVGPAVTAWQDGADLWLRRVSVIVQLGFRDTLDTDRLAAAIDANAARPEFWLRKAIGWALRDYARTDPEWVRTFVASRELSPLSRREALKHVGPQT